MILTLSGSSRHRRVSLTKFGFGQGGDRDERDIALGVAGRRSGLPGSMDDAAKGSADGKEAEREKSVDGELLSRPKQCRISSS